MRTLSILATVASLASCAWSPDLHGGVVAITADIAAHGSQIVTDEGVTGELDGSGTLAASWTGDVCVGRNRCVPASWTGEIGFTGDGHTASVCVSLAGIRMCRAVPVGE